MTLKNDAKFKEKRTCGFKYDMRNLVNFHSKIWKFLLWWAVFVQGICTRFELQKYRGVIFHDTAQWCKIWINLDFAVSKMAGGIGWNFIRALSFFTSEKLYFDGLILSKAYNVSAKKFHRNYVSWHWKVM